MAVTIYVKKDSYCAKCEATKKRFQSRGVDFKVKDLEEHYEEALSFVPDAKVSPIVVTDRGSWSDLSYDRIDDYANTVSH